MVITPSIVLHERAPDLPALSENGDAPCVPAPDAQARRLSRAIARGDEPAFEELYGLYQPRVLRLLFVLSRGDESLAHQVAQSVMLAAAAKLKPVETEAHLWHWLARVAHQQLLKEWRRQAREPILLPLSELPETAVLDPDRVLEERLDAALLALEEEDRQLIEWFYFDRMSQKEVAERLATTRKAAASRMERARAKLRLSLAQILSHET